MRSRISTGSTQLISVVNAVRTLLARVLSLRTARSSHLPLRGAHSTMSDSGMSELRISARFSILAANSSVSTASARKAWESSETIKRALKEAHRDREADKRVLEEVQPEAVHVEVAHAMPGLAVPAAATDGLPQTVVANTAVPALRPSEVNEEKKRRGPVCTVCLRSGVHMDACVNPNNRRADRR